MDEKYPAVIQWLREVFSVPGEQIPHFQVNDRTVDLLHDLMQTTAERRKEIEREIRVVKRCTQEYRLESERLEDILKFLGISQESLSSGGRKSLTSLADLAVVLGVSDVDVSSFYSALLDCRNEADHVEDMLREAKEEKRQLRSSVAEAMVECERMKRLQEEYKAESAGKESQVEYQEREMEYLKDKGEEYRASIGALRQKVDGSGLTSETTHTSIVQRKEYLQSMEKNLDPLRSRLQSCKDLPPDITLATVKVEQAKKELASLEKDLAKRVGELTSETNDGR